MVAQETITNIVNDVPMFGIDELLIMSIDEKKRKEIHYGLMNLGKQSDDGYAILKKMNRAEILALCLGIGFKDEIYFKKINEWFEHKGIYSPLLISKIVSYGFEKNPEFCYLLKLDNELDYQQQNIFSTEKNELIKRMKSVDLNQMNEVKKNLLGKDRFIPPSDEKNKIKQNNYTSDLNFYLEYIYSKTFRIN